MDSLLIREFSLLVQTKCTGTGFLVSGQRILTNAHVVQDQVAVVVQSYCSYGDGVDDEGGMNA